MHANSSNVCFRCCFPHCHSVLLTHHALRMHVLRNHEVKCRRVVQHNGASLECSVDMCSFTSNDFSVHIAHLKSHILSGIAIACPFKNCRKTFLKKSSFSSHVSRCHKYLHFSSSHESSCPNVSVSEMLNSESDLCERTGEHVNEDNFDDDDDNSGVISEDRKSEFLNCIALFCLKLQAKFLLSASKIQQIIDEFVNIHTISQTFTKAKLLGTLSEHGLSTEQLKGIATELEMNDLFKSHFDEGVLRSHNRRKTFYKKNFHYVSPLEVYLGRNECQRLKYYQYVPIKDSLKNLFSFKSVESQYLAQTLLRCENVYEDITDGEVFKSNPFFSENPMALKLILYQDSFEVVNPLGSAKSKHKILAVYYSLADLLPHHRSNTDHIQLILLCTEKDFKEFGQEKVFGRLVEDLVDLETNGIELLGKNVKGSVVAITGDNLGSHTIGGFTENFSTSIHFCRFCLIERQDFVADLSQLTGIPRNPENYNADAICAIETGQQSRGVKFASCFNKLKHFHVCLPGLSPCLGHDLFEGVVSGDVALFLKYFVMKKWFSIVQLNRLLATFKCVGSDSANKPASVKVNCERLGGNAVQNWSFLRILPLLIGGSRIEDLKDEVWRLCMLLRQIVEIVCAPKISLGMVAYLQCIIEEYITYRKLLFPEVTLKPKHHFLIHYPGLIMKFGPLMRVWTMRFEAKHSYFKQCARAGQNFRNLPKSLAEKHQLYQAFHSMGDLFPPMLQCDNGQPFSISLYNEDVKSAVLKSNLNLDDVATFTKLTFQGIEYHCGLFVVVSKCESGFVFGKIVFLLVSGDNRIDFLVETFQSERDDKLHLYVIENKAKSIELININNLIDYYPLPVYNFLNKQVIVLHHAIL